MHHTLHGIIHQPMAHDESQPFEAFGNDFHAVMPPAGSRAGMAHVQVRIVPDLELAGGQCLLQQAADALDARIGAIRGAHASSCSWMCFDSIRVWMTMKAKKMPVTPNSLKL